MINGQPAARKGDKMECSAVIKSGSDNVFIVGQQVTYLDIAADFPPWMRQILRAVTIAGYILPPCSALDKLGNLFKGLSVLTPCPERFIRYMQFRKIGYSALDETKLYKSMGSWGDYFSKLSGTSAPLNMIRAHGYHIVFQKGPAAARKFIQDSQRILREAGDRS